MYWVGLCINQVFFYFTVNFSIFTFTWVIFYLSIDCQYFTHHCSLPTSLSACLDWEWTLCLCQSGNSLRRPSTAGCWQQNPRQLPCCSSRNSQISTLSTATKSKITFSSFITELNSEMTHTNDVCKNYRLVCVMTSVGDEVVTCDKITWFNYRMNVMVISHSYWERMCN